MDDNSASYPNCPDKYNLKGIIDPEVFVRYAGYPTKIPQHILITFDMRCLDYFKENFKPSDPIQLHPDLIIYPHKTVGFIRLPGIGGPNLVAAVEELAALGADTFLIVGTAGGLDKEGVFICERALRDEGVSYHYLPPTRYVYANSQLCNALSSQLKKQQIPFRLGTTWTIDAPYRETILEAKLYAACKIDTVEMECASLYATAKYRNLSAAGVVVVGDILSETWTSNFNDTVVQKKLCQLVNAAVHCLLTDAETLTQTVPPGLMLCQKCGEYKGKTQARYLNWKGKINGKENEASSEIIEFICWCESVPCPRCKKSRIRRPISNHYIKETNSLAHTPYFYGQLGCDLCRNQKPKTPTETKKEPPAMTEAQFPGMTFMSIGPLQGMRPNPCMAPRWVASYGLSQLHELLKNQKVPSNQYALYEQSFTALWETRKAQKPAGADPDTLRKIDVFTEKLRAQKRSIFGD